MTWRLGIDIGGTFTDFALLDQAGHKLAIHKQLTTPSDPSKAVVDGIKEILRKNYVSISDISVIAHGTTLVTNAVIERKGVATGMLVTSGFEDILDTGMEQRYELFDLRITYPEPIIPRDLRKGISERVHFNSSVETRIDLEEVRRHTKELVETKNIKALAVCFLHSYINPSHESAVVNLVQNEFPNLYVSSSSDVYPNMREFERWTTTAINAYTRPMIDQYLAKLEKDLERLGFKGQLYIMTSSGGMLSPITARRFPVRLLESGPAAGMLMSAVQGRTLKLPNILSFDLGGTTAKGALVRNYKPLKSEQMEVDRVNEARKGSGFPLRIPVLDMIEIGSGGGSIAGIDDRGLLKVGPRSAGANPGPASYGKNGTSATLTDANLMLGYLDKDFFLGGEMKLDKQAAEVVIQETVGAPLGLSLLRTSWGIHDSASEDIARAFRIHAAERGFDYRSATMVAFGGSGPLHAMGVAEKLKIPRVVFPIGAGVYSALGLLASPLSFELSRSRRVIADDIDAKIFFDLFEPLVKETTKSLKEARVCDQEIRISRQIEARYFGQTHEIQVQLPDEEPLDEIFSAFRKLFEERYAEVYSFAVIDAPIEIINWKVIASGPEPEFKMGYAITSEQTEKIETALKGTREVYFEEGGFQETPIYDRYLLAEGMEIFGPALIEERESTCLITVGARAFIDPFLNIIAELGA
ncbi:MAG: hydantoinase/oxoprolinase family protein [Rhodospirillaceae bacterium]|nr:hydantoinase/oxoprolinase family protein [Rhodospirillaceae bacterium]MBT7731708.1 hydantoinase/oxoprolinase family protein [Rhodospirillaceae bacterium]